MRYVDTRVLLAYLTPEAHSALAYTLDRGMATAGSILGFPVTLL